MSEPMSDEAGLRMMQRTEDARGCHHLATALQAGADALATLADPAYRLVKVEDLEKALWLAYEAGSDCGMHSAAITKQAMKPARTLIGLKEQET